MGFSSNYSWLLNFNLKNVRGLLVAVRDKKLIHFLWQISQSANVRIT